MKKTYKGSCHCGKAAQDLVNAPVTYIDVQVVDVFGAELIIGKVLLPFQQADNWESPPPETRHL